MAQAGKNVRLLAWFNFFLGLRLYTPVVAVYFVQVTGSLTLASIVIGAAYVVAALFEVPTGVLSDFLGRKHTAVVAAAASVVSVLFYAWGASLAILLIGAAFEGLRRALVSGNNEALLYESLSTEDSTNEYARQFGRTDALLDFALAVSAPVGSLVAAWSMHAVMWFTLIPQLACVVVAMRFVEPPRRLDKPGNVFHHLRDAFRSLRESRDLRILTVSNVLSFGVADAGWYLRPAYVAGIWPTWALGFATLINSLSSAVSSWFAGPLVRRFGAAGMALGGSVFQRVTTMASLVSSNIASPALMSASGFGYGPRNVGERTMLQEEFTDQQRATMSSLVSLLGSLCLAIALVALGALGEAIGVAGSLFVGQVVMIIPTVIYWRLHSRAQNRKKMLDVWATRK